MKKTGYRFLLLFFLAASACVAAFVVAGHSFLPIQESAAVIASQPEQEPDAFSAKRVEQAVLNGKQEAERAAMDETDEETSAETSKTEESLQAKSINLNQAGVEELQRLPGIGPVLAQRIVEYREECGEFFSIEEILEVKGIGEKTFAKIEKYLTV